MNKILIYLSVLTLFSCTPDDYEIVEFDYQPEKVKYVETKINSDIYYKNGVNTLDASFLYYDIVTYIEKDFEVNEDGDTITITEEVTDTLRLKNDRVPLSEISFYDENNEPLEFPLVINDDRSEIEIFAEVSGIRAEKGLKVSILPLDENHDKVTIPVVFHMIESKDYDFFSYEASDFQRIIDQLNAVYDNPEYRAANSGNPNIEFTLAKYDPNGILLGMSGVNALNSAYDGADLSEEILDLTEDWSPEHYLNIYVSSAPAMDNYLPTDVFDTTDELEYLEGLDLTAFVSVEDVEAYARQIKQAELIGILIGAHFEDNISRYTYHFLSTNWPQVVGQHLGLIPTVVQSGNSGTDYCFDTFEYSELFKNSKEKKNLEGNYFDSENILDQVSTNKVISAEQVKRVRWVLENCPSRQPWKSSFALTGNQ